MAVVCWWLKNFFYFYFLGNGFVGVWAAIVIFARSRGCNGDSDCGCSGRGWDEMGLFACAQLFG